MSAFITRVNNPRVKILTGKVRIITSGLISALISPKIITVRKSDQLLVKCTPGTMYETKSSINAFKIQRSIHIVRIMNYEL